LPANYPFNSGDSGVHTFTNAVTLKKAGSQTVTVTDTSSSTISGSASVTVTAANANHVSFVQQPTNTAAGSPITPALTVEIFDAFNNPETSDNADSVSMAIGTKAGGGTLTGTIPQTVSGGIATFSDLSINKTGTGYTLQASSGTLTGATSTTFNITPGAASQLVFGQQPSNTPAGSTINPAVTVKILDANGNFVSTDSSDNVTMAIGTNAGGGTLSGTLTVTAQNGVATFSNLSLSAAGTGYTLKATSGSLAGATSAPFNVTAPGTHLAFNQQPSKTAAGAAISPAVVVQVLDAIGNVVTSDNSVQVTIAIGANPGGGTLSGTATITVSAGVASFGNLSINKTGVGYTLSASAGTLTGATSAPFNIMPGAPTHLAFSQQPTNTASGAAITPAVTVQVLDANNNLVTTDSTDSVGITIGTNPGGGTLGGTTSVTVAGGVASFGNLSIDKAGTGYTFKANSGTFTGATSNAFNITPGAATHLAFAQQPTNSTVGVSISPAVTVQILDANNNLVTGDSTDQVTLTLSTNPTGATLSGTNPVTVSGGVATFSNLSINLVGTGYVLSASSGTLTSATSTSINVTAITSTLIEGFENGLGLYHATAHRTNATTTTAAAHDGTFGLDMSNSSGWIYRNDSAAQIKQGETISVWVQLATAADGRAYFGFGASGSGTLSVVLGANTGQFIIQDNSGYGFTNLSSVSQGYLANHWYLVQVAWGIGGAITARLYDSNGTSLLNTVKATDNNITSGGIAFRGIFDNKYFDTVTMMPGAMLQASEVLGNVASSLSSDAATIPGIDSEGSNSRGIGKDIAGALSRSSAATDIWSLPVSVWGTRSSTAIAEILTAPVETMSLQNQVDRGSYFLGSQNKGALSLTTWDTGLPSNSLLADDDLLSSAIKQLVGKP